MRRCAWLRAKVRQSLRYRSILCKGSETYSHLPSIGAFMRTQCVGSSLSAAQLTSISSLSASISHLSLLSMVFTEAESSKVSSNLPVNACRAFVPSSCTRCWTQPHWLRV
jgi:hypothetical protein